MCRVCLLGLVSFAPGAKFFVPSATAAEAMIFFNGNIGDGLTWANANFDSIRGKISTAWRRDAGQITLDVTIPANTTATVCIPASVTKIIESGRFLKVLKEIHSSETTGGMAEIQIASGTYRFEWMEN